MDSLQSYNPSLVTKIYAADDTLLEEFFIERRVLVPLSRIPQELRQAVLAVEDADFFAHRGFDVKAIAQKAAEGHFRLLVYGPRGPEYELLGKVPKSSFTDVAAGKAQNVYEGLQNLDWQSLFRVLNGSVSSEVNPSVPVPREGTPPHAAPPAPQGAETKATLSSDRPIAPPPDTAVPADDGSSDESSAG